MNLNEILANPGMMGNGIKENNNRAAYNFAKGLLGKKDPITGMAISQSANVTEGYLRFELDGGNREEYKFRVLENQGAQLVTENRLKLSDFFLVTHLGFGLYVGAADATPAARANALVQTYNSIQLAAAAAAGTVQAVYNGSLEIRVNDRVFFDSYQMLNFYRAGSAQLGLAVSTAAANNAYVADSWDEPNWGFALNTPFIFLPGRANNEMNLSLPVAVDLTGVTLVLMARGLLIQNAYPQ